MATLAENNLTIADAVRMSGADGKVLAVAEILHQKNGIVADIPWKESDTPEGHMSVQETSLPEIYTKTANGYVPSSKGTDAQTLEALETLEGWSVIEEQVASYGGDVAGKRANQTKKFTEKFNQTVADRFFYGNGSTTVGQINGLGTRFASTSGTTGSNVILGGSLSGQTDNMSIWLIGWGENKVGGVYRKGSPGGFRLRDWGSVIEFNSDGEQRVVYKEQYNWDIGLALDDWRYVVRIPNIDKSLLIAGTGADLFDKMILAIEAIPDIDSCRPSFYMNRTTKAFLNIQARNAVQTGGQLSYEVVDGRRLSMFQGIPITISDRLTESETRIS